jgi:predicted RNase H-like nuclease
MSEFTKHKKAKITQDDKEKFNAYHDIHHAMMDACYCRIPGDKVLLERKDLERFHKKKMMDHEVHGCIHEYLIKLVDNLRATDAFPSGNRLFKAFNEP